MTWAFQRLGSATAVVWVDSDSVRPRGTRAVVDVAVAATGLGARGQDATQEGFDGASSWEVAAEGVFAELACRAVPVAQAIAGPRKGHAHAGSISATWARVCTAVAPTDVRTRRRYAADQWLEGAGSGQCAAFGALTELATCTLEVGSAIAGAFKRRGHACHRSQACAVVIAAVASTGLGYERTAETTERPHLAGAWEIASARREAALGRCAVSAGVASEISSGATASRGATGAAAAAVTGAPSRAATATVTSSPGGAAASTVTRGPTVPACPLR